MKLLHQWSMVASIGCNSSALPVVEVPWIVVIHHLGKGLADKKYTYALMYACAFTIDTVDLKTRACKVRLD